VVRNGYLWRTRDIGQGHTRRWRVAVCRQDWTS
jgi:hypothetical protein